MSTRFLEALEEAVAAAAERVGPAVVGLGRGWGRGSGVVIADGRVLTNAHVLRGDEVAVGARTARSRSAASRALDDALDVAVVAADTGGAPAIAWDPAAVEELRAGRAVFALADPGGRGLRTTFGLVTATGRSFRGPRRPPHRRLDRALGAAPARLVGRPARRCRRAGCSGSTPCGWRAG